MSVMIKNRKEIDELFEIYFSCMMSRFYFVEFLKAFMQKDGYGREYVCCSLSSTYEPGEEGYFGDTGVKISIDYPATDVDKYAVVSNSDFFDYVQEECKKFTAKYPEMSIEIEEYLQSIKKRLSV